MPVSIRQEFVKMFSNPKDQYQMFHPKDELVNEHR